MRPLVKTHGGKFAIKDWIISQFPVGYEQITYVEPFIGGGSILLNKRRSATEVINDLDQPTICLWKCIKSHTTAFIQYLETLKYSEQIFNLYKDMPTPTNITEYGVREYVLRRMSRGGLKKSFAKSNRLRGGKMGDENAWETAIAELTKIAERVKNVIISNTTAVRIITEMDSSNTFFYLDPPYLASTRTAKKTYNHEMSNKDHADLLDVMNNAKVKILVSGYDSPLYNAALSEWTKSTKQVKNSAGQGKTKGDRLECTWRNYD